LARGLSSPGWTLSMRVVIALKNCRLYSSFRKSPNIGYQLREPLRGSSCVRCRMLCRLGVLLSLHTWNHEATCGNFIHKFDYCCSIRQRNQLPMSSFRHFLRMRWMTRKLSSRNWNFNRSWLFHSCKQDKCLSERFYFHWPVWGIFRINDQPFSQWETKTLWRIIKNSSCKGFKCSCLF